MNQIIKSFLDTDLYKLTMGQAVWDQFPGVRAKYKFICRGGQRLANEIDPTELSDQIQAFMSTPITKEEADYLASLDDRYGIPFSSGFISFLRDWPNQSCDITCMVSDTDGKLDISIEGPWKSTIYLEVPVLAMVNEMYYGGKEHNYGIADTRAHVMIDHLRKHPGISFTDFGTRRRRSTDWHATIIRKCKAMCPSGIFPGTSNVMLAKQYDLRPIGTMAHEWIQAGQGLFHPLSSQYEMLKVWERFYPVPMRIALTDTLGHKKFCQDFDHELLERFAGVRQDSGDPIEWTENMLDHYYEQNVNPKDKIFVYSDCLNADKSIAIHKYLNGRAKASFGIGTNLTNNFGDVALQNVIKLTEINGRPVAKISDTVAKTICTSPSYLHYLMEALDGR
jgi:nicotinate phosphoribosyltransferase